MKPAWWKQMRHFLDSPRAKRLLGSASWGLERGEDPWLFGGCLTLAEALRRVYGGEVYTLVVGGREFGHAVLRLPSGEFVDATGVHPTEAALLRAYRYRGAQVVPREIAKRSVADDVNWEALTFDARAATLLAAALRR